MATMSLLLLFLRLAQHMYKFILDFPFNIDFLYKYNISTSFFIPYFKLLIKSISYL